MRIVGLPEFSGSLVRPSTAVSPAAKTSPSQKVAAEPREAEAPVATSRLSAGVEVPVDHERVAEIRKALESGTYPLIPTKIADAIIAAGMYGKVGK
ncbi:flagellar biosynthesis anti-sigma factor FlgM [Qipengyuania qiaonensis]|uniref:Flagellar biosynthesis anti-sigma factor FlgM n=1 Tax=Qipengyuania qiaonensis TaxID=2867240 RepID=A0ABS7J725_9SPHN|nr:flagellar biosynthesis anti-sigma factor FlgM [Qipengyuania qiaonensis]MBX7481894.1 flagellar biosynthesis anti-sigma factor FlgM [Qipengyuania qiaonensis]